MTDRVIIVTGGGSGIGRAAAGQFARKGDRVIVVGRRAAPLQETAAVSDAIFPLVADVCRDPNAAMIVETALRRWGRIDVIVNNAGAFAQRSLADSEAELITSLFTTNVLAPSLLSRAALPHLQTTHGAIVNVSSTFGHKAAPLISHYAASKAAVEHLIRILI